MIIISRKWINGGKVRDKQGYEPIVTVAQVRNNGQLKHGGCRTSGNEGGKARGSH